MSFPDRTPARLQREMKTQVQQVMERIRQEIQSAMKRHEKPAKAYICNYDLDRIWSDKSRITILLQPNHFSHDQIEFIQQQMTIILSTLVYIGATECLFSFSSRFFDPITGQALVTDEDFPFDAQTVNFKESEFNLQQQFLEQVFRFKPVLIEVKPGQITQKVHPRERLPFEIRQKDIRASGYARFDCIGISPNYIKLESGFTSPFVYKVTCKKILVRHDFDQEIQNLQILKESLTNHNRIMKHLTIIEHGPSQYILLPYAAFGDLQLFLHCGISPDMETKYDFNKCFPGVKGGDMTLQLLGECGSLAHALEWLHNKIYIKASSNAVFCAHTDLKPANILIEPDAASPVGRWMITDFGISVFKEETQQPDPQYGSIGNYVSQLLMTNIRRASGTYQAPEVRLAEDTFSQSKSHQRVNGRKSDIWSFGCIFAEVLAFSLGNDRLVIQFQSARKKDARDDYFYTEKVPQSNQYLVTADHSKELSSLYEVRPAVLSWLDERCRIAAGSQNWVECYVGTIRRILVVDTIKRPDAIQLLKLLKHVEEHLRLSRGSSAVVCPILDLKEEKSVVISAPSQEDPTPALSPAVPPIAATITDFEDEISLSATTLLSNDFSSKAVPTTLASIYSAPPRINKGLEPDICHPSADEEIFRKEEIKTLVEDRRSEKSVESVADTWFLSTSSIVDQMVKKKAFAMILEVLQEDEKLNPLLKEALKKFERPRVVNNLAGFISGYCVLLSSKSPNRNQKKGIRFLRHRCHQFSSLICHNIDSLTLELDGAIDEERVETSAAEKNALVEMWIRGSDGSPAELPARSVASDDGLGSDEVENSSDSESEDMPAVLQDVKAFLVDGKPLELFRHNFEAFVAGESMKDWNSMIKAMAKLKSGPNQGDTQKIPQIVSDLQPAGPRNRAIVELKGGEGFQVLWKCRCGREFATRISGTRRAAEDFLESMDWNEKRDGPRIQLCFTSSWIENLVWTVAPSLLGRFPWEVQIGQAAEEIDLEACGPPPGSTNLPPDSGNSLEVGSNTKPNISKSEKLGEGDEIVYICLFNDIRGKRRLKHAKLVRNKEISLLGRQENRSPAMTQGGNSLPIACPRYMDRKLFEALREKILRSRRSVLRGWLNWIVPIEISSLSFWEFKLHHAAKLVTPHVQDKLPYEPITTDIVGTMSISNNSDTHLEEWEYSKLEGQDLVKYKGVIAEGDVLLHYVKYPDHAHPDSPVWNGLPRKIKTKLTNHNTTHKLGWGFQVEYEWDQYTFITLICLVSFVGFILATVLCVKFKWPVSAGVTMACAPITIVMTTNTLIGGITKQKGLLK